MWLYCLTSIFVYNLFYIPFSLCFGVWIEGVWLIFDIFAIIINFLDIFINYMTKVNEKKKKKGSTENVGQIYFNKDFFVDLLAFFPFDYCFIALISDPLIPAFLRVKFCCCC